MVNYSLNNHSRRSPSRLTAGAIAILWWGFGFALSVSATPDTFSPHVFAHQLNSRLNSFLDERRTIPLAELGDLTRWKLLVPSELPKRSDGAPRPFTRPELTAVISELALTLGLSSSNIPELSGEHAMVLSIVKEEILATYPRAQVVVEARDGLVYSILAQMSATIAPHATIGAISFPYMGRLHPSAATPMYTTQESDLIESVMERARQVLRGVLQTEQGAQTQPEETHQTLGAGMPSGDLPLNNSVKRDRIVSTFITQFNTWFDSDTTAGGPAREAKQLIEKMLGAQIKALSLEQNKPIILFDTHGYGIKVLIGAARLHVAYPQAQISVALIESFNHTLNAQQQAAIPPTTSAPLRDIRVTWPFTLTELDKKSSLPVFRPVSPRSPSTLLQWATTLLLMYNRATIGDDHALWKEWQSALSRGATPFSDQKFIEHYTFGDPQ